MSSGFNTDVRVGEQVFHVQTEDRGPSSRLIDTAVYQNGRVLLRRSSSYDELLGVTGLSADAVRERVAKQHSAVIEELRAGTLAAELAAVASQTSRASGIQVQLLNPQSWLSAGRVSLEVEILGKADRSPQPGAQVEAYVEGALANSLHSGTTDEQGRASIQFPLPPLGRGDLALVITATAAGGRDEIRFTMRSRPKAPPESPGSSPLA